MAINPQNWSEAGLDTATLADSAPLVAIYSALGERFAAAGNPRVILAHGAPPYVAPRPGAGISADVALRIASSIRALQEFYVNPSTPYADTGYLQWPDMEKSSYLDPRGGIGPYDALALVPPPCGPIPGDTATSSGARAFYAWARASLDRMTRTVADLSFGSDGWGADTAYYGTVQDMLDDARQGRVDSPFARFDRFGGWYAYGSPSSVSCANAAALDASASIVVVSPWPLGEDADGITWGFWSAGIATGPGALGGVPVSAHSSATLFSAPGKVDPPAPTGAAIDIFACTFRAFLDFSPSFRFHA